MKQLPEGTTSEEKTDLSDPNAQICYCYEVSIGKVPQGIRELGIDGATLPTILKIR
jgi:hypothetical protein